MTLEVITVGELTLDEVVHEGGPCHWGQAGGGALFSAIGALLWGATPHLNAVVGRDYPDQLLARIRAGGINTDDVGRIDGGSLGIWLLHEDGGFRHQVPKASGSSFRVLDESRPPFTPPIDTPFAVHLAPQTTEGQLAAHEQLRDLAPVAVTQDVMIEPFVDRGPYLDGRAMTGSDAFLPSELELTQLWGPDPDVRALARWLADTAGVDHLVVKRGAAGADIVDPDRVVRIPSIDVEAVDTTGAGDAFCGGFLVGLATTGDVTEAVIHGTVSASFVVETLGADEALQRCDRAAVEARADDLRRALDRS
jgi:cytidine kinase